MRWAVGDQGAVGEQQHPLGERGHELGVVGGDEHGAVEALQQLGQLRLWSRSMPRVGSSRHRTAVGRRRRRVTEHDGQRQPLLLAARQLPGMAWRTPVRQADGSQGRLGGFVGDALVDQIVAGFWIRSATRPAAAPSRGSASSPGGVAEQGRLAGAVAVRSAQPVRRARA